MKAKLGIAFEELRGKAGNSVGKMSSQGQILMIRSIGTDPKTQSQIRSRQLLTFLARRWARLTQEQRDAWNTAAGLKRSGYDLFCEYNTNLNSVSSDFIDDYKTPRTLQYYASIEVEISPKDNILSFRVNSTVTQSGFKLLVKISNFTPRLMSADSYRYVNLIAMKYSTNEKVNAYPILIGRTDLNLQDNFYFKTEYYVIDTYSGAREFLGSNTFIWTDTVQPYIPSLSLTVNSSNSYYDSTNEIGEIYGKYQVANFEADKKATIKTTLIIWNDAARSVKFYQRVVQDGDELERTFDIYADLDGGSFPQSWNKGILKYIEFVSNVTVTESGNTYEYHSELSGITAK